MIELNEQDQQLLEDYHEILRKFEEWISAQPHIPKTIPKTVLFRYVKINHFDLEESKKLLDINVKFRIKNQYLFTDRDIESEEFQKVSRTVQYTVFPKLTKEGYAVESYRIINSDLNNFNLKDIMKLVIMAHDVNSLAQLNINGVIAIYDATGFTFQHFMRIISNAQTSIHFSQYGQEVSCINLIQVHYINCSSLVTKTIDFFKSFLSQELKKKLYFHSEYEALHDFIDIDCLPVEYGGTEGSLKDYHENTLKKLHKYRDFVKMDENFFLLDN
ncbi:alpha-tocopherol transfer protein-like [Chironomus tepperi]|uniref:alpha-tocopherol transfer protein-like n=1 Tax=Chironomus tepperi TaxID=113505 RepID=UPI00391F6D4B